MYAFLFIILIAIEALIFIEMRQIKSELRRLNLESDVSRAEAELYADARRTLRRTSMSVRSGFDRLIGGLADLLEGLARWFRGNL